MNIQRWTEQEAWDAFVTSQRRTPFQQTWQWGEFQKQIGVEVLRWAIVSGSKIVGVAQVLFEPWRFGQSTLTGFHAPVVDVNLPVAEYQEALGLLLRALVEEARQRQVISLHLETPIELCNEALFKGFEVEHKFRRVSAFQPLDTLMLDLSKSSEVLLAAMHEKTRYNIRLAERKGVKVEVANPTNRAEAIETFIQLNLQTAKRDRFQSHGPGYYRRLAEYLPPEALQVYVAYYQAQPIAANLVVHAGDMATYVHGASGDTLRNLMAPHLLQWRQILDAQQAGKKWYDFFGIETANRPRASKQGASWAGITRFKQGFGGVVISYLPAYELPVKQNWYSLVRAVRIIRGQ